MTVSNGGMLKDMDLSVSTMTTIDVHAHFCRLLASCRRTRPELWRIAQGGWSRRILLEWGA